VYESAGPSCTALPRPAPQAFHATGNFSDWLAMKVALAAAVAASPAVALTGATAGLGHIDVFVHVCLLSPSKTPRGPDPYTAGRSVEGTSHGPGSTCRGPHVRGSQPSSAHVE
jgi:hypothetical protein